MKDGVTWRCDKPYHPIYYERPEGEVRTTKNKKGNRNSKRTPEEIVAELKEIRSYQILENRDRKISYDTMKHFRIRTAIDESTGEPSSIYYPETSGGKFLGFKQRKLPKRFNSIIKPEMRKAIPDFSGQSLCPRTGKRLLITGGEEDMLAFYECIKGKYPDLDPCVVSLPRGEETSGRIIAENLEFLSGFSEIIIGTDMDKAGREAIKKIIPIIGPERCRVLNISEKDISDMWVKGKGKELINAFYSAKEYRPSNIVGVDDILEDAIQRVKWGLSYPWDGFTQLTYGLKEQGEIIGLGAAPGAGKSTILQQIQKHLMFAHGERIAIFDIEEGHRQGLKKLIGSIMKKPIHLPDCEYDLSEAKEVGATLSGLAEFYGGDSENWDEVEDAIRYFASRGIRFFFIDPLSALVEHLSASDGNTELGRIMRAMRKFRKHQGLTFFHANHLNNPSGNKDHGEGAKVKGSQFSGSRAQWKYSTLLLGLEGNQLSDSEEEKHKRTLRVIKDRLGGKTGVVPLLYQPETGLLVEEQYREFD